MDLDALLKAHFGYNAFRAHQKEIVSACLEGRDVLAILPTGAGKSICYQLPAMVLPGVTLVISPLISLMQDQVVGLCKSGLSAALLNSSLHHEEMRFVMGHLEEYKLLYVAPERLSSQEFVDRLKEAKVSLVAIDEAHCISQWGHSFRPEYRQLALLKQLFPNTPVMALTATATREVEKDIASQLAMQTPFVVRASFDRPNLTLRIAPRASSVGQWMGFLAKHEGQSGIIYSATRKGVEEAYDRLQREGMKVGRYHAGLSDAERAKAQHDFIYGECLVMVATVAFGMGIHKPDIRFIVHLDMPRSVEQYYQEVGRAGRDGLPSECLMLYSAKEFILYKHFLKEISDEAVRLQTKKKTEAIYAFCTSTTCRRKGLLRYFGETYESGPCEGCDVCLDSTELVDATVLAQKILSCVYRVEQKFGIGHVIDVLRGAKTKAIFDWGHDKLSTFNLLADCSAAELQSAIAGLIEKGLLERTTGDYPVLRWTDASRAAVRGETLVMLRKKSESAPIVGSKRERKRHADLEFNRELFDQLSQLRRQLAAEGGVPAYVIFSDRTLIEMSQQYPKTQDAMLKINGVGAVKWERYGQAFIDVIAGYKRGS